jgi:hypothetical protein
MNVNHSLLLSLELDGSYVQQMVRALVPAGKSYEGRKVQKFGELLPLSLPSRVRRTHRKFQLRFGVHSFIYTQERFTNFAQLLRLLFLTRAAFRFSEEVRLEIKKINKLTGRDGVISVSSESTI